MDVFTNCWNMPVRLPSMLKLKEKLMRLKQRLKQWNKETFGHIFLNLMYAKENCELAEITYDRDPLDVNLIEMYRVTTVY